MRSDKALDKIRALKVRPQSHSRADDFDLLSIASEDATPEKQVCLLSDIKQLIESLKHLKPQQQECLVLSCYFGHSHQELAQILGKPVGTIKAWIRRGKKELLAGFR